LTAAVARIHYPDPKEGAMGRSILAVVVGYVVLFVVLFCVFTAAYLMMGPDGAFQPGSFRPSMLWNVLAIVLGLAAAVVGGLVCYAIARKQGAVTALVVVILVIGFLSAIPVVMAAGAPKAVREGSLSNMEAMMQARQPVWMALLNPVLGAVGVLLGARLLRNR
jgi:hypothetical protein